MILFSFYPENELMSERLLKTNKKLEKRFGRAARYLVTGLSLAPAKLSGHEVCEWRTAGCTAGCVLHFAGRRVMPVVRERAKRITRWLFSDRAGFETQLRKDISAHLRKCAKLELIPAVRLNVGSDLDWLHIIREFPDCTFYDYTKSVAKMMYFITGFMPPNYELVFSDSERADAKFLRRVLESGHNVARVFDIEYNPQSGKIGKLPQTVCVDGLWVRVVDGDRHDVRLRRVDGKGVVIGLRLKGTNAAKSRANAAGFAKEGGAHAKTV